MDTNYYQDIIGKINHFISEKNWQEALKLVKEELDVVYIPSYYEEQFNSLYHEIITNINHEKKVFLNDTWSLEKILEVINDVNKSELHLVAFYHLQKHNVRLILPIIITYLINIRNNDFNKTQLLYILKEQRVDQEIEIIKFNEKIKLNPVKLIFWKESDIYKIINKDLQKKVEVDNPGLYKICIYLLNNYFQCLVPKLPSIKQKNALEAAVYIRSCNLQFMKVSLLSAATKFNSTQSLIKKFLLDMQKHEIN